MKLYTVEGVEDVEAGDDEVSEGDVVDLLRLVVMWQHLIHHLQERNMPLQVEEAPSWRWGERRRRRRLVRECLLCSCFLRHGSGREFRRRDPLI